MSSTTTYLMGALLPLFAGCASGHAASECPEVRQPGAVMPVAAAAPAVATTVQAPVAADNSATPPAMTVPAAASTPVLPSTAPQPTPASSGAALPELKLHLSGMHIGGGPNDEADKRPFIKAIEASFDSMRACYRKADDPTRGGTFGVDLRIAGKGGKPEVQQVRTALKGAGLKECLETAFKEIQFGPPPKGPTVVSVSVKFSLGS